MKSRITTWMAAAILSALVLSAASQALAGQGVVAGRLMFYNNLGNYCPEGLDRDGDGVATSRNCTAAQYRESEYRVDMPLRDMKVELLDSADRVIGQGATDANGNFKIAWVSLTNSTTGHLVWTGEHKDRRFFLATSNGGRWVAWTWGVPFTNGTSSSSPQQLGSMVWGSNGNPSALANAYDAALRTWRDSLSASSLMTANFTNVEIRLYDGAACPTSCAMVASKRVLIDSEDSVYRPQARIMHELGHIASGLSHPGQNYRFCGQYNRNNQGGWNQTSAEHACASFEEGLATFLGDRAIYWQSNPNPTTCNSTGICATSTEATTGTLNADGTVNSGACVVDEGRRALTVNRYLRDLYDSNAGEATDTQFAGFSDFFRTLNRFANGVNNNQKDEPWNSNNAIDDQDGRSGRDFRTHFEALTDLSTSVNFQANCSPVGD